MTRLTVEQEALVGQVANAWRGFKAERAGAEARVRALVAADVAKSIAEAKMSVSAALAVALDAGVPKRALKEVTTKDRPSFEALLPAKEAKSSERPAGATPAEVHCSWEGELIRIRLDPLAMPNSEWNPTELDQWTGLFEHFVRPHDGKVFIDPVTIDWRHSGAVIAWYRSDENESKVIAWAAANPRL